MQKLGSFFVEIDACAAAKGLYLVRQRLPFTHVEIASCNVTVLLRLIVLGGATEVAVTSPTLLVFTYSSDTPLTITGVTQ